MDGDDEYTSQPWHITYPRDLPAHLRPACDFINTELALDPPFAAPVDSGWLHHVCNLYDRSPVNLETREKSLRKIMQGLEWRFEVQQKIIQLWWELLREGLGKIESIKKPLDLDRAHDRSSELKRTLFRFEYLDWLKGYGGGYGAWDNEGLRGQSEDPVTWLAVSILRSDARLEHSAKVVEWIERQGVFGVLREEVTEEEEGSPETEYGWIDEDGMGYNERKRLVTPKRMRSKTTRLEI